MFPKCFSKIHEDEPSFKNNSGHSLSLSPSFLFLIIPFLRSSGSTLRTRKNPEGRPDSRSVRDGNILACRAFLICLICATRGILFVLEQPRSSVMEYHPCFVFLSRLVRMYRVRMNMLDYGGPTQKATILYCGN